MGNMFKRNRKVEPESSTTSLDTMNANTNNASNCGNEINVETESKTVSRRRDLTTDESKSLRDQQVKDSNSKKSYFLNSLEDVVVSDDASVNMKCQVDTSLNGSIRWYRNNVVIENSERWCVMERNHNGWNQLTINNVK